jgi:hypothetical protein
MSHLIQDSRVSQDPFDPFAPTAEQAEAMDRLAAQPNADLWPDDLINDPKFIEEMNARDQEFERRLSLDTEAQARRIEMIDRLADAENQEWRDSLALEMRHESESAMGFELEMR